MLKRVAVLLGIFLSVGAVSAQAVEKLFYRYVDASNKVVILDRLPPDVVPRGYDVIRADGSVVKSVAPQLTEEEREALRREKAVARARAEASAAERSAQEAQVDAFISPLWWRMSCRPLRSTGLRFICSSVRGTTPRVRSRACGGSARSWPCVSL